MNREIEEMANDYYEAMLKARGTLGSMNDGAPKWYAKELYAKGWRKSTDVAREIFDKIERLLDDYSTAQCYQGEVFVESYFERGLGDAIAELRKKYESEGEE